MVCILRQNKQNIFMNPCNLVTTKESSVFIETRSKYFAVLYRNIGRYWVTKNHELIYWMIKCYMRKQIKFLASIDTEFKYLKIINSHQLNPCVLLAFDRLHTSGAIRHNRCIIDVYQDMINWYTGGSNCRYINFILFQQHRVCHKNWSHQQIWLDTHSHWSRCIYWCCSCQRG